MIRYAFNRKKIEGKITSINKSWLTRAQKRTKKLIKQASYAEKTTIWSTVKPVFMEIQAYKCAFCEKKFENEDYGKIEFDVEHFRPKSAVKIWPDPAAHPALNYTFSTGGASATGYYWLAYELENYLVSCKVCNSYLKHTYFPIAGVRRTTVATISELKREQPDLCSPLDWSDDDPEDLITFDGTIAIPRYSDGKRHRRGRVIIDLFELNDRDYLHQDRAKMIVAVGWSLRAKHRNDADQDDLNVIAQIDGDHLPHTSCLRAYRDLWTTAPQKADALLRACKILATKEF